MGTSCESFKVSESLAQSGERLSGLTAIGDAYRPWSPPMRRGGLARQVPVGATTTSSSLQWPSVDFGPRVGSWACDLLRSTCCFSLGVRIRAFLLLRIHGALDGHQCPGQAAWGLPVGAWGGWGRCGEFRASSGQRGGQPGIWRVQLTCSRELSQGSTCSCGDRGGPEALRLPGCTQLEALRARLPLQGAYCPLSGRSSCRRQTGRC